MNTLSKFISSLLLFGIAGYRAFFSSGNVWIVPFGSCRFHPTCSAYAEQAIRRFGVPKGLALGLKRIARCRPYGSFGYDSLPNDESLIPALPAGKSTP